MHQIPKSGGCALCKYFSTYNFIKSDSKQKASAVAEVSHEAKNLNEKTE